MAHELFRLREKILNAPQLMHPTNFEVAAKFLDERCTSGFKADVLKQEPDEEEDKNRRYSYNSDTQVAIINIDGPLTNKPVTFAGFDCGGTSYQQIKEDFTYLAEQGAKTVAFMISSGGGEAYSVFPSASYVKKIAAENDIHIPVFVDGLAASAAYAWAAIGDEVIMAPSSEAGSIGVVVRLINDSKALEMNGYERTFIYKGEDKVPYNKDGSFRQEFLDDLDEKVTELYKEFTEFVAEYRNISVEAVRSTEAKTFLPEKAIELGLADRVMTLEDFYTHLADVAQDNKGSNMLKNKLFSLSKEGDNDMTQLAQLQEQFQKVQADLVVANASVVELASLKEQFTNLQSLFSEKETALAAAMQEITQMKEVAETMKLDTRKSKLAAVMSADKVESVSASLSTLDDSAFETVLSGFAAQKQALEASDMFTEIGDQGTEAVVETTSKAKTSTEDLIKQKLGLV